MFIPVVLLISGLAGGTEDKNASVFLWKFLNLFFCEKFCIGGNLFVHLQTTVTKLLGREGFMFNIDLDGLGRVEDIDIDNDIYLMDWDKAKKLISQCSRSDATAPLIETERRGCEMGSCSSSLLC